MEPNTTCNIGLSPKWRVIGYPLAWCGYADSMITGEKTEPSQLMLLVRNVATLMRGLASMADKDGRKTFCSRRRERIVEQAKAGL